MSRRRVNSMATPMRAREDEKKSPDAEREKIPTNDIPVSVANIVRTPLVKNYGEVIDLKHIRAVQQEKPVHTEVINLKKRS